MIVFFAKAVEPDDIRMQQPLEGLDLLLEALAKAGIVGQMARQHLYCGSFARFAVPAGIYRPHAAAAKELIELVRTEPFEGHGGLLLRQRCEERFRFHDCSRRDSVS